MPPWWLPFTRWGLRYARAGAREAAAVTPSQPSGNFAFLMIQPPELHLRVCVLEASSCTAGSTLALPCGAIPLPPSHPPQRISNACASYTSRCPHEACSYCGRWQWPSCPPPCRRKANCADESLQSGVATCGPCAWLPHSGGPAIPCSQGAAHGCPSPHNTIPILPPRPILHGEGCARYPGLSPLMSTPHLALCMSERSPMFP